MLRQSKVSKKDFLGVGPSPALAHNPGQRGREIPPEISAKGDSSFMGSFGNGIEPFRDDHPLELPCPMGKPQATSNYLDLK